MKYAPLAPNYIDLILQLAPPGPIAEFGVYNGGNIWRLSEAGREVWAFDTFQGLPAEDYLEEDDKQNPPGCFYPDDGVVEFLETLPNVHVMKGRFADTLSGIPVDTRFSCIYLDCDYYNSHTQVLTYLDTHKHIGPGTLIIFDDYPDLPGTKRAIDEWRGDRPVINNVLIEY